MIKTKTKTNSFIVWLLVAMASISGISASLMLFAIKQVWLPGWLFAAIEVAILFGIFFVFRSQRGLRKRFIVLLAVTLAVAPIMARLMT